MLYTTTASETLRSGRNEAAVAIESIIGEDQSAQDVLISSAHVPHLVIRQVEPVAGIARVAIREGTAARGSNESDDDLRSRVRGLLDAAGGGTRKAIENAVMIAAEASSVRIRDRGDEDGQHLLPGQIEVVVDLGKEGNLAKGMMK